MKFYDGKNYFKGIIANFKDDFGIIKFPNGNTLEFVKNDLLKSIENSVFIYINYLRIENENEKGGFNFKKDFEMFVGGGIITLYHFKKEVKYHFEYSDAEIIFSQE